MFHSDKSALKEVTIVIPSKDEDPRIAADIKRRAGCNVIVIKDRLYGEAIKEGVRKATTRYVLTMDADGQHTYEEAVKLASVFKFSNIDMMIGERRTNDRNWIRATASTVLNCCASAFANRWVVDLNSGMRIFRRDRALSYEAILCNDFSYTTSIAMSFLADRLRVEWFPIIVRERQEGKSHVRPIRDGIRTLYYIVRIGLALRTRRIRRIWRAIWSRHILYP